MAKKSTDRLIYVMEAVNDLVGGLNGKPFAWGDSERRSKEAILASLGFAVVSKTKLERGGHRLKRGVRPVGSAFFGSPLRRHADLYVLYVQTQRSIKFYELLDKGKALLEGAHQFRREEYAFKVPAEVAALRSRCEHLNADNQRLLGYIDLCAEKFGGTEMPFDPEDTGLMSAINPEAE